MKKFVSFITAAAISVLSAVIPVSAEGESALKVKISDASAVRGSSDYAVFPLDIIESSGFSCLGVRIIADGGVNVKGYKLKEDFAGEFSVDGNTFIWITDDTMNNYAKGTFADIYADVSAVKYPGKYDVSFFGIDDKTMAVDEDANDIAAEWINGTITINGNEKDIADASLMGDADGDGEITSYDALYLLKNVIGMQELDAKGNITGDVDFDDEITSGDALKILQRTTSVITDFSGSVSVGVYLDSDNETVLHKVYYKDENGSVMDLPQ